MFQCHVWGNTTARADSVSEVFRVDERRVLVALITDSATMSQTMVAASGMRQLPGSELKPTGGNAVKYFEPQKTEVCGIGRQKTPSLREGRALRPGEGRIG